MIKIILPPSEENPFIVVQKPKGLPSAPLSDLDTQNAFFEVAKLYPQVLLVNGKKSFEHGLLHRLDTLTSGLILIATTQNSYDFLLNEQKENRFIKHYSCICDLLLENAKVLGGFPSIPKDYNFTKNENTSFIISSTFRNYGLHGCEVRPVTETSSKYSIKKSGTKIYSTKVYIKKIIDSYLKVSCTISLGYRHQVRSHLAWIGLPICGDVLYNSKIKNNNTSKNITHKSNEKLERKFEFYADKISFVHPITKQKVEFFAQKDFL